MAKSSRILFAIIVFVFVTIALYNLIGPVTAREPDRVSLSQFRNHVFTGEIKQATFRQSSADALLQDGERISTQALERESELAQEMIDSLLLQGAEVEFAEPPLSSNILAVLSVIAFPLMIIAMIYFLVLRPAQRGMPPIQYMVTPIAGSEAAVLKAHLERLSSEVEALRAMQELQEPRLIAGSEVAHLKGEIERLNTEVELLKARLEMQKPAS